MDHAHQMLDVEGRREGNMGMRKGILKRPEHVSLFMGRKGCRHSVGRGAGRW